MSSSRMTRRVVSAALASAVAVAGLPAVAGAALESPLTPTEDVTVIEPSAGAPLTPGVASSVAYSVSFNAPTLSGDGFAWVTDDGDDFLVEQISLDGTVEALPIEFPGSIDAAYAIDAVTDEFILLRALTFTGFDLTSTNVVRVDRSTGGAAGPFTLYPGAMQPAQMNAEGSLVATYVADDSPVVLEFSGGALSGVVEWDDTDFTVDDPQPHFDPGASRAAVAGERDGSDGGEIWIRSLTESGADQKLAVPCFSIACDFDISGFTSWGQSGTIFFSAEGITEVVRHYQLDVATGEVSEASQMSMASDNGRYTLAQTSPGPSENVSLSIRDVSIDRFRVVTLDLDPDLYEVTPVSISDDGLTIRYTAEQLCPTGFCVLEPAYFGEFELLPVAEVTRGPAEDQILRLYRAVFGRIPDASGFEFWMDQYRNGRPLVEIAAEFAASDEFIERYGANPSDEELIEALYQNVLGRAADSEGLAFWLAERADGTTTAQMLVSFADSSENLDRTATRQPITVGEGRVLRLYRAVLGREPDTGGLLFWLGEYNTGIELTEMARLFTGQDEYRDLYGTSPTNAELVDAVYLNVLGRPGDSGGVAFWLGQLDDGLTVPELFVEFANSDENVESTGTVR